MDAAPAHPVPSRRSKRTRLFLSAGAVLAILTGYFVYTLMPANAATSLLSQGKPTTASSTETAGWAAANATDGNTGTRWSSAFADPQWLQVDLGVTASISQVVLNWEAA